MKTEGIILEALDYAKANALITSDDYQNAKNEVLKAAIISDERDTLMKRYREQVEVIRQEIDNGGLSTSEKNFIDRLNLPKEFDRRLRQIKFEDLYWVIHSGNDTNMDIVLNGHIVETIRYDTYYEDVPRWIMQSEVDYLQAVDGYTVEVGLKGERK